MQMTLPSEVQGLDKCMSQQKDVQHRLEDLVSEYKPLAQECHHVLSHDNNSPASETLADESAKMEKLWAKLHEMTALYMTK